MQELPAAVTPGAGVLARATVWVVEGVERGAGAVTAIDLVAQGGPDTGLRRTLLTPFDDVRPCAGTRLRRVGEGAALGLLGTCVAVGVPWPAPEAALTAKIDLHAHQLSAAIALRTGRAARVLVADPVGSGKTITAAVAVADLRQRAPDARVLLAVPAGLVSQWRAELAARFDIEVDVADGAVVAARADLDTLHDPWTGPGVRLASFDHLKRPDAIGALNDHTWDLLVVDEAHHAARGTQRHAALHALARRSRAVLLLTATPHDGDEAAFRALCDVGAHGPEDALLVLRRTPGHLARRPARREHRVVVPLSEQERHARRLLAGYLSALRHADTGVPGVAALLAAVLEKRAASSPFALRRSVERRSCSLQGETPSPTQSTLPFREHALLEGDSDDEDGVLAAPTALPSRHERAWLGAIASAALAAQSACPRVRRLRRLAARLHEPLIVFTEYRDTLAWLDGALRDIGTVGHLHGGQTPAERARQLREFESGRVRVLLATDAAAEGLNLQGACRAVVQFDAPWTPVRSEQRVGRVDRLGQRRRVHAWCFSSDDAVDTRLAGSLRERANRVADAMRACGVGGAETAADRCCADLRLVRQLRSRATIGGGHDVSTGPAVHVARLRPRRAHALGLRKDEALAIAVSVHAGEGERLERQITPVRCRLAAETSLDTSRSLTLIRHAEAIVARHVLTRQRALEQAFVRQRRARLEREGAILLERARHIAEHFAQLGLFTEARAVPPPSTPQSLDVAGNDATVRTVTRVALLLLPRRRPQESWP